MCVCRIFFCSCYVIYKPSYRMKKANKSSPYLVFPFLAKKKIPWVSRGIIIEIKVCQKTGRFYAFIPQNIWAWKLQRLNSMQQRNYKDLGILDHSKLNITNFLWLDRNALVIDLCSRRTPIKLMKFLSWKKIFCYKKVLLLVFEVYHG